MLPRTKLFLAALVVAALAAPVERLAAQSRRGRPAPPPNLSPLVDPDWGVVEAFVWETLEQKKKYERDDLITTTDVEPVLARLGDANWDVPQQEKLLDRTVNSGDQLATLLGSKRGLKFMRSVSNREGVYDQLDRLLQLPGGDRMVRDMIHAHNGVDLLEYYFDHADRGINLSELLPNRPNGRPPQDKDFRKPTGRIYTGASLIEHLQVIYEAQLQAIAEAKAKAAKEAAANDAASVDG